MRYGTAKLVGIEVTGTDNNLNEITEQTETEVFVTERSVTRSEFYQASATGIKPSVVLRIDHSWDYNGETRVIYENKTYTVLRAYRPPDGDWIELTLTEKRGHNVRG